VHERPQTRTSARDSRDHEPESLAAEPLPGLAVFGPLCHECVPRRVRGTELPPAPSAFATMGLRRGLLPFVATALGCLLAPRGPTPRRQAALPTERRDVAGEGALREDLKHFAKECQHCRGQRDERSGRGWMELSHLSSVPPATLAKRGVFTYSDGKVPALERPSTSRRRCSRRTSTSTSASSARHSSCEGA
jgi:hypothetical protein